ncbi:leucyl/phenylalanyl-tRNA--protein transferase [marine bacterium AO1-C]|nr:leucyl/phenylalanyl-tRNA--protein transferase [marine bacterium AO1-C]
MGYTLLDESMYFPPVHNADEHGILAFGGDLSVNRLLLAYQSGIFPWYNEDDLTILWWSPDPRFVLFPQKLRVSKSMRQILRKGVFKVTYDENFRGVITACKEIQRPGQAGTWITNDMVEAYCQLHEVGFAHSVEVWSAEGALVGGLYGVSLGSCFFGESMFSKASNASKTGFISLTQNLVKLGITLIDCQVYTQHLESLGGQDVPRDVYMQLLNQSLQSPTLHGSWTDRMRALDAS